MNERKTSPLAIISLIAGICGWTVLPLLGTVAAIITGHMARAEIRRSSGMLDGDGMAMIGLVLGWLQVVITVVGLLFIFLFLGGLAWFASVAS